VPKHVGDFMCVVRIVLRSAVVGKYVDCSQSFSKSCTTAIGSLL